VIGGAGGWGGEGVVSQGEEQKPARRRSQSQASRQSIRSYDMCARELRMGYARLVGGGGGGGVDRGHGGGGRVDRTGQ
jgi:hypothetical protein